MAAPNQTPRKRTLLALIGLALIAAPFLFIVALANRSR